MSANRAAIDRNRATLIAMETELDNMTMSGSVPSRTAAADIDQVRHLIGQARITMSRLLRSPVTGEGDPLDLPPHPQGRWGEEIIHDGGAKPDWIGSQEWVGNDDFSSIASARVWSKVRSYRLRADHPYYREAAK